MARPNPRTVAYIDAANLHRATRQLGWNFSYRRFRVWLAERHGAGRAVLFIGFIAANEGLYRRLRDEGYELSFRDVSFDLVTGAVKGNCDADLVLAVARDLYEGRAVRVVIVSSDGDYAGLVKFLMERDALEVLVSPAPWNKCSMLLRRLHPPLVYLDVIRDAVEAEAPPKKKSSQ